MEQPPSNNEDNNDIVPRGAAVLGMVLAAISGIFCGLAWGWVLWA